MSFLLGVIKKAFSSLWMIYRLALLGHGIVQKGRIFFFLFYSRIRSGREVVSKSFLIRVGNKKISVAVRNNFSDPYVLYEAFVSHDYDQGLPSEPPGTVFDVGANVGYVALYLKVRFPNARIYCFEPDPDTFVQLKKNISQFPDMMCYQYALGAERGERIFYRSPAFHMRNSLYSRDETDEKIEVKMMTFLDAMNQTGVSHVDLLKIDIEGGEYEVLKAMPDLGVVTSVVGELHPFVLSQQQYSVVREKLEGAFKLVLRRDNKKEFFYGSSKN